MDKIFEKLEAMAQNGQITWTEQPAPKPTAMRAISGETPEFGLLVVQARIAEEGGAVKYFSMLTLKAGQPFSIIKLPADLSEKLYRAASAAVPPPAVNL